MIDESVQTPASRAADPEATPPAERTLPGSREEFAQFYYGNFHSVYAATLGYAGSHESAADATQEAFARAWARWRRLRRHGWSVGWVVTTAINASRRQHRKDRSHASRDLLRADNAQPGPSELRADIVAALRRLPPKQRETVVLHYIVDCPIAVVADLMDVAEGTVKAHLSAGRTSLSSYLPDYAHRLPTGKGDTE